MGVLLHFPNWERPAVMALAPTSPPTRWRVCNICMDMPAIVLCLTHQVHVCPDCIKAHELMEGSTVVRNTAGGLAFLRCQDEGNHCHYVSRSALITVEE